MTRGRRIAARLAVRMQRVLTAVYRFTAGVPFRRRRRLAAALHYVLGQRRHGWQDRLLASGDPASLLRGLDPAAAWFDTVLVDGWPAYPVRVSGEDAWLIVSRDISVGHPIRAVFFPASGEVFGGKDRNAKLVPGVVAALRDRAFPERSTSSLGALVVGNINFAHMFLGTWNALHRGRSIHGFRTTDRLHDRPPATMGSYTEPELFPELAGKVAPLDASVAPDGTYAGTLVPLGIGHDTVTDWRLETELRLAVRRTSERIRSPASEVFAQRMAAAPFVLWVSVRGQGKRTALNFREWILATLAALHERQLDPFVAFDGLSIQPGYALESVVRGAEVADQVQRERELVSEIMAGSPLDHAYIGGLPLYDAFYLSRFASFYVCHQGSLDHKIKWLNPDLPGLVHANLQRTHEYAWEPTLDTQRALFVPARFIRDEKPDGTDKPVWGAKYPYRIEPVQEAATWTAERIAAAARHVVASRPAERSPGPVTPAG